MTRARVDATDFVRAEVTDDGERVVLTLAESGGGTVVLSLPASCVAEMVAALPRYLPETTADIAHPVHSWRLEASPATADLTLTLRTPEGRAAAFRVTSGQVAGMATLATYGALCRATAKSIN
jgi:hypothetical protein